MHLCTIAYNQYIECCWYGIWSSLQWNLQNKDTTLELGFASFERGFHFLEVKVCCKYTKQAFGTTNSVLCLWVNSMSLFRGSAVFVVWFLLVYDFYKEICQWACICSAVVIIIPLLQGQALTVAGLATLISLLLGLISGEHADIRSLLLVGGASMSAACLASALLGGLMIVIVMVSKPLNINPDNIATPIAASLGDLVTLTFLSFIAHGLYSVKRE